MTRWAVAASALLAIAIILGVTAIVGRRTDSALRSKTNMTHMHGWNKRSAPLIAKAPHGHWKTRTLLAALRCDETPAPFVLDGPIKGESFLAYVEQAFRPRSIASSRDPRKFERTQATPRRVVS